MHTTESITHLDKALGCQMIGKMCFQHLCVGCAIDAFNQQIRIQLFAFFGFVRQFLAQHLLFVKLNNRQRHNHSYQTSCPHTHTHTHKHTDTHNVRILPFEWITTSNDNSPAPLPSDCGATRFHTAHITPTLAPLCASACMNDVQGPPWC